MRCWALLLLCAVAACDGCGSTAPAPQPTVKPKPQVPVPAGLAAEAIIPDPAKLLAGFRDAARGPALFVPRTVGGVVVNALGMPLQAVELIDERLPIVAASLAEGMAGAVHIRDRRRFVATLTKGEDSLFTSKDDGDFVWLTHKHESVATIAVVDNYLVIGQDEKTVRALGPFLTRNVATEQKPKSDVAIKVHKVGPLVDKVTAAAALLKKFSLPAAAEALIDAEVIGKSLALFFRDQTSGDISIKLTGAVLDVDAKLKGKQPELPQVAPAELGRLPDDTVAALAWSESADARAASAHSSAKKLKELLDVDADGPLTRAAHARGDRTTFGARCTGIGVTGFASGEIADAKALRTAVKDLVGVSEIPQAEAKLKAAGLELKVKETRIKEVPHDMWRLRLIPKREGADPRLEAIDLLYTITEDRFYVAAGMETIDSIQHMFAPNEEALWSSKEQIKAALGRMPKSVWFAALVDAQGVNGCLYGRPGGTFAAPVALSAGPTDGGVHVRFEIARGLIKVALEEFF